MPPALVRRTLGCALALFALLAALTAAAGPTRAATPGTHAATTPATTSTTTPATASTATPTAASTTTSGQPVLGDYATPLVGAPDANGVRHIDTPATIASLGAAHVNTYAYLIYGRSTLYGTASEAAISQSQWDDLPGFATAAAAAGIDVLVYLVPPSESTQSAYEPFGWDYTGWADAIATLAVSHPNIREMVMDDFAVNTVEGGSDLGFAFTPGYVGQMMDSARAIASWLKFRAIFYYPDIVGNAAVLPAFRPVVDGVIFPYRASTPGGGFNTTDASAATQQGGVVGALAKCHGGQHCAQIEFPKNTASTAGDFGQVSQTVSVSGAAAKTLSFWEDDDFGGTTSGFHTVQALVDGTVVWQSDVAASGTGLWQHVSVDVSSALAGKSSATLAFRVWDAHAVSNFHVTGFVDDVSGSGFTVADGGFENAAFAPWTASANTAKYTVALVPTLSYYFMTYASRFSNETQPTSTTYVRGVLGQALDLMSSGVADGSLVYTLNLTGQADGRSDPATYGVVQELYGPFATAGT
jgi:hypothetical protein